MKNFDNLYIGCMVKNNNVDFDHHILFGFDHHILFGIVTNIDVVRNEDNKCAIFTWFTNKGQIIHNSILIENEDIEHLEIME